jgi:hypothetical protein
LIGIVCQLAQHDPGQHRRRRASNLCRFSAVGRRYRNQAALDDIPAGEQPKPSPIPSNDAMAGPGHSNMIPRKQTAALYLIFFDFL